MKAKFQNITITREFLDQNPLSFFVFGDNTQRTGTAGAAALRGHPRVIGFVTKKLPNNNPSAFFKVDEYIKPFFDQLNQLANHIKANPNHTFYISKLGSGLANYHYIWEKLIGHNLVEDLKDFENVVFCWEEEKIEPEISNVVLLDMPEQHNSCEEKLNKLTKDLEEANAIIKSQQDMYMREIMQLRDELSYDSREHGGYSRAAANCD